MKWTTLMLVTFFLSGALFFVACTHQPPPAQPVSFDWDKGPIEIDAAVSKYPKNFQDTYNNVIKMKCTQCHPLSRALWAPYYEEDLWKKVATKMANRPGSQVDPGDVDKIAKFMVYDHTQRKSAIEKMLQDNHWEKKDPIL